MKDEISILITTIKEKRESLRGKIGLGFVDTEYKQAEQTAVESLQSFHKGDIAKANNELLLAKYYAKDADRQVKKWRELLKKLKEDSLL